MNAYISLSSSGNGKIGPNFLYKILYWNVKTLINLETLFMRYEYVHASLPVLKLGGGATLPLRNPIIFPKFSNSYSLICDIDVVGLSVLYANQAHRTLKGKKKLLPPLPKCKKQN